MSDRNFLGQFDVNISETPYANYTKSDWMMEYIQSYGQIDGSHHKQWVLDQVARIHNGTKVILQVAKWDDGLEEYRYWLDEPSQEYIDWVKVMKGAWIESEDYEGWEYDYDEGIAP